ncbi:MAG: hypothetical protein KAZ18_00400 [Acinetobacter sp.]|nr:hypothetical protein [Acinetobacter sp.]
MSVESAFIELFKHSIVINWNHEKQMWMAECLVLNIRAEASSYKALLADVLKKILLQEDYAFNFAEEHKPKIDQ